MKLDDTYFGNKKKQNLKKKVKGYLRFGVVIVKVVEGAVVRVVGFVQQLDRQRPAEGLRHERVLEEQQRRERICQK